jgi:hypothetical protein
MVYPFNTVDNKTLFQLVGTSKTGDTMVAAYHYVPNQALVTRDQPIIITLPHIAIGYHKPDTQENIA